MVSPYSGQEGTYSPRPGNDIWVLPAPNMECWIGSLLHETGHWIDDIKSPWYKTNLDPPLGKYQHYWDERPDVVKDNDDGSKYGYLPELIFSDGVIYDKNGNKRTY